MVLGEFILLTANVTLILLPGTLPVTLAAVLQVWCFGSRRSWVLRAGFSLMQDSFSSSRKQLSPCFPLGCGGERLKRFLFPLFVASGNKETEHT